MDKKLKLILLMAAALPTALGATPVAAQDVTAVALPNPVGWPEILFVLGLTGFAFWKRSWLRLLLSICIIIWGVFAVPYDLKIGAPLIAIGTVLFFLALMKVWRGKDIEVDTS
jgi:hypothetical protein